MDYRNDNVFYVHRHEHNQELVKQHNMRARGFTARVSRAPDEADGTKMVTVSVALCGLEDGFCRAKGRAIADAKADMQDAVTMAVQKLPRYIAEREFYIRRVTPQMIAERIGVTEKDVMRRHIRNNDYLLRNFV